MHEKRPQIVSITSQGQVTIPKTIRQAFRIKGALKAVIWKIGDKIIMEPRANFWSLAGSLSGKIKLSDRELKKARKEFSRKWAKNA